MKRTDRDPAPASPEAPGPDPVLLLRAWWGVVGPQLGRIAAPRGVESGRLLIALPDARWEQEIRGRLPEILPRLRARRGLEGLRWIETFVEPPPPVRPAVPETRGCPSAPNQPPEEIARAADLIRDADLSRRWTKAVARLLERVDEARGG